jgi:protein-S-isoprenylcysteine O-methyltransferase Ste14
MKLHLGSVVWYLANTAWLGSKFFGAFTLLVVKVYNLCRV